MSCPRAEPTPLIGLSRLGPHAPNPLPGGSSSPSQRTPPSVHVRQKTPCCSSLPWATHLHHRPRARSRAASPPSDMRRGSAPRHRHRLHHDIPHPPRLEVVPDPPLPRRPHPCVEPLRSEPPLHVPHPAPATPLALLRRQADRQEPGPPPHPVLVLPNLRPTFPVNLDPAIHGTGDVTRTPSQTRHRPRTHRTGQVTSTTRAMRPQPAATHNVRPQSRTRKVRLSGSISGVCRL